MLVDLTFFFKMFIGGRPDPKLDKFLDLMFIIEYAKMTEEDPFPFTR